MKIAILAPANNVHTIKWLHFFNQKGYEVINISFKSHEDHQDRSKWQHVRTIYLDLPFNHKLSYFFTVKQLKKILDKERPHILHSHYISSYGVVGALTNFNPYIVSVWGTDIYDFPKEGFIQKKLVEYALKKANVVCSTSEDMKIETSQYTKKNIKVTPFGVDCNTFRPLEGKRNGNIVTFGIVKTMSDKYGIDYLIKAYNHFKNNVGEENFQKTRLVIVGGGSQLQEYKNLAKDLLIDHQVTFTGKIPHYEVPEMINSFDVFFVPSNRESFGVAAVEAQACEVPVVVSNVGGLPEVTIDRETGFIIQANDFQAIAEKMELLFYDEELRIRLGKNGRKHVLKHYQWNDNAELMSSIYEEILNN